MTHAAWGKGDLFSIAVAACLLIVSLLVSPRHRSVQGATVVLASGLSLRPLLLIIFDPLAQGLGWTGSLLELVLSEGRATLWWAAAVASLYVCRDLF